MRRHLEQHIEAARTGLDTYRNLCSVPGTEDRLHLEAVCLIYRELTLAFYETENYAEQEIVREAFDEIDLALNRRWLRDGG